MVDLLILEDYEVKVSPEALTLKPFKKIWDRDKSKYKQKALNELSYIYFMYNPKSDYMFITDEDERAKEIMSAVGMKPGWKPDVVVREAIDLYVSFRPTAFKLLESIRETIDYLRKGLKDIDFTKTTSSGALVYSFTMVTSTLDKLISLADKLVKAEKALNQQVEEQARMRGSGTKKILEDGF